MPSQAEIDQYQQDVDQVSALAVVAVAGIVLAASGEDNPEDSMAAAIPAALEKYMAASAQLAMNWYRGLAREKPRKAKQRKGAPAPVLGPTDRVSLMDAKDFMPRPADMPPRAQIERSVWWAISPSSQSAAQDTAVQQATRPPARTQQEPRQSPTPQSTAEQTTARPATRPAQTEVAAPAVESPAAAQQSTSSHAAQETPHARVVPADEQSPRARIIAAANNAPQAQTLAAEATDAQALMISRLAGPVQRYVNESARETLMSNADREGVRWVRHASANACAFCRLLATRGGVYTSEEAAGQVVGRGKDMTLSERRARAAGADRGEKGRFIAAGRRPRGTRALGEKYHDNCHCIPIPVRAGDTYVPPPYVDEWEAQYIAATRATPRVGRYDAIDVRAVLAHMRAHSNVSSH